MVCLLHYLQGLLKKIDVQLIYNVILISATQQSDSVVYMYIYIYIYTHTYIYIYTHTYSFSYSFSIMAYYRILNIFPCVTQ